MYGFLVIVCDLARADLLGAYLCCLTCVFLNLVLLLDSLTRNGNFSLLYDLINLNLLNIDGHLLHNDVLNDLWHFFPDDFCDDSLFSNFAMFVDNVLLNTFNRLFNDFLDHFLDDVGHFLILNVLNRFLNLVDNDFINVDRDVLNTLSNDFLHSFNRHFNLFIDRLLPHWNLNLHCFGVVGGLRLVIGFFYIENFASVFSGALTIVGLFIDLTLAYDLLTDYSLGGVACVGSVGGRWSGGRRELSREVGVAHLICSS